MNDNISLYELETDIEKIDISFSDGLKNLNVEAKNFKLESFDTLKNQRQRVNLANLKAQISLFKLIDGDVEINKIAIDSTHFFSQIEKGKPLQFYVDITPTPTDENTMIALFENLNHAGCDLAIKNFSFEIIDDVKNKRYSATLRDFSGKIEGTDSSNIYNAKINMDAWVDQLGFNLAKGSYGRNSAISNFMDAKIDANEQVITVKRHPLTLNNQVFQAILKFYIDEGWSYSFDFENKATNFAQSRKILSDSIEVKLNNIEVEQPLYSHVTLDGKFAFRNNPVAFVDFKSGANTLKALNQYTINTSGFWGTLTNREARYIEGEEVDLQDLYVHIAQFDGSYNRLPFELTNANFEISKLGYGSVDVQLEAKGKLSLIDDLLSQANINISKGSFELDQYVEALLLAGKWKLNDFDGKVSLENTQLELAQLKDDLLINNLKGHFNNELAEINDLDVEIAQQNLSINGKVENYENLINGSNQPIFADFNISSPHLSLEKIKNDLLAQNSNGKNKKVEYNQLLSLFEPDSRLSLMVNRLETSFSNIDDIATSFTVVSSNEIALDDTHFDIGGINTIASGNILLQERLFANLDITTKGNLDKDYQIFDNTGWKLDQGNFAFSGKVQGFVDDQERLIKNFVGEVSLSDTDVYFEGASSPFYINQLDVKVNDNNAYIEGLNFGFESGNEVDAIVELKGVSNLVFPSSPIHTAVNIKSDKLDFSDFLFGKTQVKKQKPATLEEQKEVVWTAFNFLKSYQPQIDIDIKEFVNGKNHFRDVGAALVFDDNTLNVNQLTTKYGNSMVKANGPIQFDAVRADSTFSQIITNMKLNVSGSTIDYNTVFQDQDFEFTKGKYNINARVDGKISNFDDFAKSTEIELLISDDVIKQISTDVAIDLDSLYLLVDGAKSELKLLTVPVNEVENIRMSGEIHHFLSLFSKSSKNQPSTQLNVYAKNLNVNDFLERFDVYLQDDKEETDSLIVTSGFKEVLLTVFRKYDPSLNVVFDRANYRNVVLDSIIAKVNMSENEVLKINKAGFEFPGGFVDASADVDLSHEDKTPFEIHFLAENVNIVDLIASSKNVGLPQKDLGGKLSGNIFLNMDINGEFDEYDQLQTSDLQGAVKLHLDSLRMEQFKDLIENIPLLSKERFEDIQYAPIDINLNFENGHLEVDRFEVQSNAFQLFLEGFLKEEGRSELWLSIPLDNLKKRENSVLPKPLGYYKSSKKVFLVYQIEEGEEPEFKFRLSNKKLFKEKGQLSLYKQEKKKERRLRREYRREIRQEKKNFK